MPVKHKTKNVFQFKKFSERIGEVDLRSAALYRIEHVNEIPDEDQSYFYQTHQKWIVLNLTEEFTVLEKQLRGVITTTLAQLLHHKEKVIECLLNRLDNATTLSLQPLLELTVALAKDLREEFYVHFQRFFERLIKLLKTQDPDQTEWTLVCLAYLFKVLKSFLCKDISIIVHQIIPLLSEKNQPDHIINFAVECFAFLVRNLRDKDGFLLIILKIVKQDDSSIMGCGKLFFEMIRGLNGQFHSKGEEFLAVLFDAFRKPEYKKYLETLNEVLIQSVGSILDYIELKHILGYWNILHKSFDRILNDADKPADDKAVTVQYLLHFLGQSIEYHGGKKVTDLPKVINLVIQIIDEDFPADVMTTLSKVGATLLLSKNFIMGQLEASRLSKKILHINDASVFESFVVDSIGYSQFDVLIMPDFLKYFERNSSKATLEILAKIVNQRSSNSILEAAETENYNINLRNQKSVDEILNRVLSFNLESSEPNDLEEFLLAIQVLPHLMTFDKEKVEKHLAKLMKEISKSLKTSADVKQIYLLAVSISTLHSMTGSISKTQAAEMVDVILPLVQDSTTGLPCMKILRFLLQVLDKSQLNIKLFEKIHQELQGNLLSPYHDIRLITFQILSSFEHLNLAKINEGEDSIFSIFKQIEEITPTIQTYRDQILLLQKLEYDSVYFQDVKGSAYIEDAIKFCIGFLNVKFMLLWEPTKGVLESYMIGANLNVYWKIFKKQLEAAISQQVEKVGCDEEITENDFINEAFTQFAMMKSPLHDPIAYRVKLWQVLSDSKSNIHDAKQRDIVELFFDFFTKEYRHEDEDEDDKEAPKARQKLLISHLQVLAKLNNPKCVFKSDELRALYPQLLFHRNFQVQKLALDCITQYKEESVATYKTILQNILNEKTFRQELVGLKLNEKIREDHREGFVKVLLPILYSKMTIKASKKDQEAFKNKKEIIVRFMSNLHEPELNHLVNIAIDKISPLMGDSVMKIESIEKSSNLNIKVNELQSKLQFLDLIKKNVAGLFSVDFQRKVLNCILAISSFTVSAGEDDTSPNFVSNDETMFKNLRQLCLASLVDFFEHFDEFDWSSTEMNVLFEVFIFNKLEEFHKHSSQNVTGLMKLFVVWSKNPKYFNLLKIGNSTECYALKSVMKLLTHQSTTNVVVDCVLDILERLLTLKLDDEVIENVNYGTKLVEPFIPEVLMKLKISLSSKRTPKSLNQRNLLILARITELVTDVDSSKMLLDILFPLTLKKSMEPQQDGEGILKLMTTISNLLKVVPDRYSYIKQISPLFEQMQEVNHRKMLVKVFNQLMSMDTIEMKSMVNDLNAYDRRWIEQPDFERRLSVFHRLEKIINNETLKMDQDLAIIIIFHCFHFLKHEKDLAMRDNSGHFLKLISLQVIRQCIDDKPKLDLFVDKILLNLIQKRIQGDSKVRTESIQLLGELAREYPSVHPILTDLHPLTNAANREQDFFDNVTHLQTFRHMKGLRKFVQVAEAYKEVPNLRMLNEFLLPIGRMFLCQEEYKRKSKVVEAAIEYVATISKFLPWKSYELLLKSYIRKLRSETGYQKQLIKLIPAILDSFHFDLSRADPKSITTDLPELAEEEDEENESEAEDEIDDEATIEQQIARPLDEITMLEKNKAQNVIKSLTRRLIPSLFRVITEISTDAHKLNKETRRAKEKADMLKIPIALPIIKLLQKLPSKFLHDYLSQVVLKVSSFLKSNLKQVRATSRHTLKEIMIALGPSHLETVIGNLKGLLCKGFQVHVLSITIHTLMDALKPQMMEANFADKLVQPVLSICIDDIFGKLSEEHDIDKIAKRTPEAKPSRKSFLTLNILAATVSEKCVLDLLMPFKTQLHETQSKKTVGKIQECLQKVVTGLTSNPKIPDDALMILIHGTISESIFDLLPEKKKHVNKPKIAVNDSFIIAAEPKRRGAMVANKLIKTSKQTNSYILVEFGLEMLHIMLKKKKFPNESFLNPLVPMLCDSLRSNYLRVNTFAVKCLAIMWHHQLDLESLKTNINAIITEVFAILHKYATNQISKKDNHYLLVKSAFKCVVVLMRQVEYYAVNENQLKALLLYVEQDLNSFDKDTMAFTLLKSILDKKLMVPEIHEIMKKVAEISVTSESDEKRAATRPIVLTYLMEYPIGKKVDSLIKFFIAQLNYEEISGRESAILMMGLIFKHFPLVLLRKFSGLLFLALGARLVNDDSPKCREKIAEILELLIKQLDNNPRQQLFDIVLLLLKDKKLVHREMAAQLSIRFVNAEGAEFEKRILVTLPLLLQSITSYGISTDDDDDEPGKFVRVKKPRLETNDDDTMEDADDERDQQTIEDHHLIQTLNAIIRIFEYREGLLKDEAYSATIDEIGYQAHHFLSHDHIWVRLRALRIINFMIKSLDQDVIEKVLREDGNVETKPRELLYSKLQFRSVVFDMVVQLKPDIDQEVLSAIMENITAVSKVIKTIPFAGMVNDKKDFNLMWLIRRLRYAIHSEIASTPSSCILRKSIFEYFNLLLDIIDQKTLAKLASSFLTPMLREMAEGEHGIEELKQVASQVGSRIKSKIGLQEYDKVRLELQSKMLRKRVDRRKALAQEKINNPAKAATRTIVKQLKKQDTKKRRREHIQEGIILPRKKRRVFGNGLNDTYE